MRLDRHAHAAHRVATLAAHRDEGEVAPVIDDLLRREPDEVGHKRSGQGPVRGDEDDQAPAALTLSEQRMLLAAEDGREVRQHLVDLLRVRARSERRVLGALELGRGHELHRPGDLADVANGADPAPNFPLTSHGPLPNRPGAAAGAVQG